ncbi:MAG TPA: hypothetical protein VMT89_00860, partial [Candidatus Acidoferrales bacterium]|nr:hypothetical protein [Candidatus Acidoferrales bacterium]
DSLQHTAVGTSELAKAKNGLESAFVLGQDSLFFQALLLGQYEVAGDWHKVDEYVPSIRAVTAADVQRVAQTYLIADNRTVGTLDALPVPADRPAPMVAPPPGMVH